VASVNIFETLRKRVEDSGGLLPQERRAMFWFRDYKSQLQQWQSRTAGKSFGSLSKPFAKQMVSSRDAAPGFLYFYMYDPIGRKTLDTYDRMPFTLVLDQDSKGFLGVNFHYLPYRTRAIFFDKLYADKLIKNRDPLKARIDATYEILNAVSKYKAFRPCLKRYLYAQVRTPLLQVGESEWDIALFLPVDKFAKMSRGQVWSNSARQMKGH